MPLYHRRLHISVPIQRLLYVLLGMFPLAISVCQADTQAIGTARISVTIPAKVQQFSFIQHMGTPSLQLQSSFDTRVEVREITADNQVIRKQAMTVDAFTKNPPIQLTSLTNKLIIFSPQ